MNSNRDDAIHKAAHQMNDRVRIALALIAVTWFGAAGSRATAAVVAVDMVQYASTTGTRWKVVDTTPTFTSPQGLPILPADSNALGGDALLADFSGSDGRTTYDLIFPEAGTYYVYLRYSIYDSTNSPGTYGNEDSIFMSHALGVPLDLGGTSPDIYDFDTKSHGPGSGFWDGIFHWDQVRLRGASADLTYTIGPADVGVVKTLEIDDREPGGVLDYLILSTENGLTERQLNGIVPEPSTAALLATGALVLLGLGLRKRRSRGA